MGQRRRREVRSGALRCAGSSQPPAKCWHIPRPDASPHSPPCTPTGGAFQWETRRGRLQVFDRCLTAWQRALRSSSRCGTSTRSRPPPPPRTPFNAFPPCDLPLPFHCLSLGLLLPPHRLSSTFLCPFTAFPLVFCCLRTPFLDLPTAHSAPRCTSAWSARRRAAPTTATATLRTAAGATIRAIGETAVTLLTLSLHPY